MRYVREIIGISCVLLAGFFLTGYIWPVRDGAGSEAGPFEIVGTLGEVRNTDPQPHFHGGVDIPNNDGRPVYAVADGTVTEIGKLYGENAPDVNVYIQIPPFRYVHTRAEGIKVGNSVNAGDKIGVTAALNHVHLEEFDPNNPGRVINPLREKGGLDNYKDTSLPQVGALTFYRQVYEGKDKYGQPQSKHTELNKDALRGKVDVLAKLLDTVNLRKDAQVAVNDVFVIVRKGHTADGEIVLGEKTAPRLSFDVIDETPGTVHLLIEGYTYVYHRDATFKPVNYLHWVTNYFRPDQNPKLIEDSYWWTSESSTKNADAEVRGDAKFPDGKYRVVVGAWDIRRNGFDEARNRGTERADVSVNNFAPDGKRIKAEKSPAFYDAEWVPTSGNKQRLQIQVDKFTNAGTATITIEFGEPVEKVVLRIGKFGSVPVSSDQAPETRTIWKALLKITDVNHLFDGTHPIELEAVDMPFDKNGLALDSAPSALGRFSSDEFKFIDYEPGIDRNHHIRIDTKNDEKPTAKLSRKTTP